MGKVNPLLVSVAMQFKQGNVCVERLNNSWHMQSIQ